MGVMSILKHYKIAVAGLNAVVIGRSHIVGRPMAEMLTQADATVTICHSRTKDLKSYVAKADLVVAAAGRPRFLNACDFKAGAVVVDVGIHRLPAPDGSPKAQLCGDVDPTGGEGYLQAITPVPGGVGPMTIISLMENTLALAKAKVS